MNYPPDMAPIRATSVSECMPDRSLTVAAPIRDTSVSECKCDCLPNRSLTVAAPIRATSVSVSLPEFPSLLTAGVAG